jgi:putative ABC transport system permease protein
VATLSLALRSLWNRRTTALLTLSAIAVSVALLLGVEKMRTAAREGFANTVSGVDLIVGARSGQLNLLLYSVFRVGDATANVSWASYQKIARHPDVAWTVPISLGDSHRGFRVMGTTGDYFRYYRFAGGRPLEFSAGRPFQDLYDAVLGADVAQQLGYGIGTPMVVAHGLGRVSFAEHGDKPFRVVGILARTGTPVDRTVHVSLEAITAIHIDWQSGVQAPPGSRIDAQAARAAELTPESITAFMVGMRSRVMTFTMQRAINDYRQEPLMAILRSVGARPRHVFTLLVAEAGILASGGVAAGVGLMYLLIAAARPVLETRFGIFLEVGGLRSYDLAILGTVVLAGLLMGALPAWRAYRNTLSDGLTLRV